MRKVRAGTAEKEQRVHHGPEAARDGIEGLLKRLEAQKDISEDCHQSLKWCMAHPWRNLWRCVKEHFRF